MQLENWPIDRLRDYERNPRKNDHAVDRMVANMQQFGFRIPVLARSGGEVIDGHLRLKAARALKLTEIPVLIADDMTDAQVKAFRIAVNKSAEWADWDDDLLREELDALGKMDFDLAPLGFEDKELSALINGGGPALPPDDFRSYDESIQTEHNCPKCGYKWSGGKVTRTRGDTPE